MGSRSAKIEVSKYYMSMLQGLCLGMVDSINEIRSGGKIAWTGRVESNGIIDIARDDLHGGLKKEGGWNGHVHVLRGGPDQVMPEALAAKLGRSSATCPGFRGFTSIFFTGRPGAAFAGFYFTANTPYLQPIEISVTRLPRGLLLAEGGIARGDQPKRAIAIALDLSTSPGTTRQDIYDQAIVMLETIRSNIQLGEIVTVGLIIARGGYSGFFNKSNATSADIDDLIDEIDSNMALPGGGTTLTPPLDAMANFFLTTISDPLIRFRSGYLLTSGDASFPELNCPENWTSQTEDMLDKTSGTLNANLGTAVDLTIVNVNNPDTFQSSLFSSVALNYVGENDAEGLSLIDAQLEYDLQSMQRPERDANPAHILFEVLASAEAVTGAVSADAIVTANEVETRRFITLGLELTPTLLDVASFAAAATTLYDEGLVLSLIWRENLKVKDFVKEILAHIDAALFTHPRTGLLTLSLIRADWDSNTVREANPSNARLTRYKRRTLSETVNDIRVSWTDPETEDSAPTPAIQNLSNIAAQGGVVSDDRNFYGVRRLDLAVRLGERELHAASALLASLEMELDRSFWDVVPGEVLKVVWPDREITALFGRVIKVEPGDARSGSIRVTMVEDVFAGDLYEGDIPNSIVSFNPRPIPRQIDFAEIVNLPAFFAADVDEVEAGDGFVALLAAQGGPDVLGVDVWFESANVLGTPEWEPAGDRQVTPRGTLTAPLVAELTSTFILPLTSAGGQPQPGVFLWLKERLPALDEDCLPLLDDMMNPILIRKEEFAVITAWNGLTREVTIARGVLDTSPKEWPATTPFWLLREDSIEPETIPLTAFAEYRWKILPITSGGAYSFGAGVPLTIDVDNRSFLPLRPGNVQVEGQSFVEVNAVGQPTLDVTWANRNRLLEQGVVTLWGAGNVTPEAGQTTTIRLYDADTGALLQTYAGLTGTSHSIPAADWGAAINVRVEVFSVRDGLESFESFSILARVGGHSFTGAARMAAIAKETPVPLPANAQATTVRQAVIAKLNALSITTLRQTAIAKLSNQTTTTVRQTVIAKPQ